MINKLHIITCLVSGAIIMILVAACQENKIANDVVVITATGDITAKMDEFRQMLGDQVNTKPGATGGHREINWDSIPDSLEEKALPLDFFNPAGTDPELADRQKGLVYEPTGKFMVSGAGFANINNAAAAEFAAFSGDYTFANVTSNLWEIDPEVPGLKEPATVKGFGIVFIDVDLPNSTSMEFFNEGKSLGKFFAPVHDSKTGFSFLGVYFKNEKVTAIKVMHDGILADAQQDISQGGTKDLVVMDDFLYDEPVKK
jgi:hypothetical protein